MGGLDETQEPDLHYTPSLNRAYPSFRRSPTARRAVGWLSLARSPDPSLTELRAQAEHATRRVALERRRIYLGRGDAQHLAELERIAAGATGRLRRAERIARSGESHG